MTPTGSETPPWAAAQASPGLSEIVRSVGEGASGETRSLLRGMDDAEVANVLEATPPKVRGILWEFLEPGRVGGVLNSLDDEVRGDLAEAMGARELAAAADDLDTDDLADILQQLPDTLMQQVLESMSAADRGRVEVVLSYPDDTAGGMMNTDTVAVRPRHSIEVVMRYLRRRSTLPEATDQLFVVDAADAYLGVLRVSRLLTADPKETVREVMDTGLEGVPVDMPDDRVARLFAERDLVSAPVVTADGRLAGRITIDDVVDVIIEDADETLLAQAGLEIDEETFTPVLRSARRRAIWLGVNLITAFLAAAVINVFEETIAEVVALAVLMPIVASMGGIAGTQTLTLVIRGMALGQIAPANLGWFLNRELLIAALNGLLWAALVAVGAALAFQDGMLGGIIALAMVINILVAALAGSLLPSLLAMLGVDPAIAGGVVLTTVTDVAGFFTFLGLATLVYA